ncbi:MAG: hypothetical protein R3D99_06935 [Altererythrobacter sp.]
MPCTIRLLDPPLHEFLPHGDAEFAELANATGYGVDHLKRRAENCTGSNYVGYYRAVVSGSPIPRSTRCRRGRFEAAWQSGEGKR